MPTKGHEPTKIAVIGSYAQAMVLTAERIPLEGETLLGWDYRETYGGKGSDMAVQAARLGSEVTYLGVVGDDAHGQAFQDLAKNEGIDLTHLRVTDSAPTGVGMIIKDQAAHNVIVVDMGANDQFSPADIDDATSALQSADVALAQLEIPLETALHGLQVAKQGGAVTVLNPAPAKDLREVDLAGIDVLTPNETEAKLILGLPADDPTEPADLAHEFLARGVGAVVMTLGEKGAGVFTNEGSYLVPAVPVDSVDSNGAGDSFNAGLSVGLGEGKDLLAAVSFAVTVSGLCCTRWETVPSYHDRAEVEQFRAAMEPGSPTKLSQSQSAQVRQGEAANA